MKEGDLTSSIIGICIEVHKTLGPGLLESIYERAICLELGWAGIRYLRQEGVEVSYKGVPLDLGFRPDFIIENKVILELKSCEHVLPVHKKILLTYLKLTELEVGLLINFREAKLIDGITRLVN